MPPLFSLAQWAQHAHKLTLSSTTAIPARLSSELSTGGRHNVAIEKNQCIFPRIMHITKAQCRREFLKFIAGSPVIASLGGRRVFITKRGMACQEHNLPA